MYDLIIANCDTTRVGTCLMQFAAPSEMTKRDEKIRGKTQNTPYE